MKTFKILILGLFILTIMSHSYGQSLWQHDDVSATKQYETKPDIAAAADGTAHVVFRKETAKKRYTEFNIFYSNTESHSLSSPLQITNTGTCDYPNIAVDLAGKVHVAFINTSNYTIAYLNNVDGSFSTPVEIPSVAGWSWNPDIDVDINGYAHIVFATTGIDIVSHLYYATNVSGSFVVHDLGDLGFDPNSFITATIDEKDGIVHIAIQANAGTLPPGANWNIYYINNEGGTFNTSPILVYDGGGSDQHATVLVSRSDIVNILHEESNRFLHSIKSNGSFNTNVVYEGISGLLLPAIGPSDEINIVSNQDNGIIFLTNINGSWSTDWVTSPGSGDLTVGIFRQGRGIAIDGSGYTHVVGRMDRGSSNHPNFDVRYHTNNPDFGQPPTQGSECFVQGIAMSLNYKGKGKPSNRGWTATATVLVQDDLGNPVLAADVSGHWSGLTSDTDNGTTGSDGRVSLDSDRINATGTFTFTVTDVNHSNLTYNPSLNVMTSNSIPNAGKIVATAIGAENDETSIPTEFRLLQNYPNPFNPETTISYQLPEQSQVTLKIYNFNGQLVRSLLKGQQAQGNHSVVWDGMDDAGQNVSSGVYVVRMVAGTYSASQKISLIR